MGSQTDSLLLSRALRQFNAEVFLHPVWFRFACRDTAFSAESIWPLLQSVDDMRSSGDFYSACSLLLLCAALQARLNDDQGALQSIELELKLARRYHLWQCVVWGYWGAAAICAQQGAFRRSTGYLVKLCDTIKSGGDWVLANLIEMICQTVDRIGDAERKPVPISDLALPADHWLQVAMEGLFQWGKVPPGTIPEYPAERGAPQVSSPRGWRSFWLKTLGWLGLEQEPAWTGTEAAFGELMAPASPPPTAREAETPISSPQIVAQPAAEKQIEPQIAPPSAPQIPPKPAPQIAQEIAPQLAPQIAPTPEPFERSESGLEMQFYFLGSFRVYQDEQPFTDWPSQKSLSLLKYLAANQGKPIPKDILMEHFWADTDAEVARRNLHQAIYALRQALKRGRPDFPYILFENDCYRLNPDLAIWLDFEEFEKHVRAARRLQATGSMVRVIDEYGIAEALYQGDFLEEDLYDDWPNTQRVYYRNMYLELLGQLSVYHFEQKQYYAAIILCQKTLAKDNCAEQAYRCLIECYLAQGQRQLAAREYLNCVQVLKKELNLPPSEETRALYQQILARK